MIEALKPKIKIYLSAHKYLGDYYNYRKTRDPQFSFELWAAELGFKSKSSLRMVCRGQKIISDTFIKSFARSSALETHEEEYFYLLAHYQNAKSPSLKRAYLDKIVANVDTSENYSEVKNYFQFLSSPALPVLQLIISFSDFQATEEKITDLMGLDTDKVKSALKTLEELGLAQFKNSFWSSKIKYFKIPDKLNDEALVKFHQATTQEAHDILELQLQFKKFKSIFFSLSEENYLDLSQDLEEFIAKVKFKYGNNQLMNKQLYKVNFQAYPVTKKLT